MKFQINKTKLPNYYNHNSPAIKNGKFNQVLGYGYNATDERDNTVSPADAHQKYNTTTAPSPSVKVAMGTVHNSPGIRDKNTNNFIPYAVNSDGAMGSITSPTSEDNFGHF